MHVCVLDEAAREGEKEGVMLSELAPAMFREPGGEGVKQFR